MRGGAGLLMPRNDADRSGLPVARCHLHRPDDVLLALRIAAFALTVPLLTRPLYLDLYHLPWEGGGRR